MYAIRRFLEVLAWLYPANWIKEITPARLDYKLARWVFVDVWEQDESVVNPSGKRVCTYFWTRIVGAVVVLFLTTILLLMINCFVLCVLLVRWFCGWGTGVFWSVNTIELEGYCYKEMPNGKSVRMAPWEVCGFIILLVGLAFLAYSLVLNIAWLVYAGVLLAALMIFLLLCVLLLFILRGRLADIFPHLGGVLYAIYNRACPRIK